LLSFGAAPTACHRSSRASRPPPASPASSRFVDANVAARRRTCRLAGPPRPSPWPGHGRRRQTNHACRSGSPGESVRADRLEIVFQIRFGNRCTTDPGVEVRPPSSTATRWRTYKALPKLTYRRAEQDLDGSLVAYPRGSTQSSLARSDPGKAIRRTS